MRRDSPLLLPPPFVRLRICLSALALLATGAGTLVAQAAVLPRPDSTPRLLLPARLFDGQDMHDGWGVLVRGDRIVAAGPASGIATPAGTKRIELPGTTLMPGLIEARPATNGW